MSQVRVVRQATSADCNRSVTLLSRYKNFQNWYDVEIDRWVNGQVQVTVKDCLDVNQAFDFFERQVKNYNLIEKGLT